MDFQGFQSGVPFFIMGIAAIVIVIVSWYSYKKYSSISSIWKFGLASLRALALLIILILLLNPFFKKNETVTIKPKVAVLLDGSESTGIIKGNYSGSDSYNSVLASLQNLPNEIETDFYKFGNEIQTVDPNGFSPDLGSTNLYEAIDHIISSDQDYSSAVLVSDGIITVGKNPVVLSSDSNFPIHVIGIGDSSQVKDISIQNVITNSTGFTETNQKVSVEISQFGFQDRQLQISLSDTENQLDTKQVRFSEESEVQEIDFEIELKESGLKQFQINAQTLDGELIEENNQFTFSVEVLDSKKRILHVASSIHPDVKMIRSILSGDQNIELFTFDDLGSGRSFKNYENLPDQIDLIILHGSVSKEFIERIGVSDSDISTLKFSLLNNNSQSDFSLISSPFSSSDQVYLEMVQENQDHPILGLPELNLRASAPLFGDINNELTEIQSTVLYESVFQNISTEKPLIAIHQQGNIRQSHVAAFGWYRMFLSSDENERRFVIEMMNNLVDWTSSDPDNRLLKIRPVKNAFNPGETPTIKASLINESGDNESNATIEVIVSGENYNSDFTMKSLGSGNYDLEIPSLPDGSYEFSATATKGTREIDAQTGEFLVSESNTELANVIRNNDLLQSIAANSSGIFVDHSEASDFWNMSEVSENLESKTEIRESYLFPVHSFFWFIAVIALLTSEWLLRKKFALP